MKFPRYDCHLHTSLSPCGTPEMTPQAIFRQARALGMAGLCLTDHFHRETPFDQFLRLRREVSETDTLGLEVWIGCEVNVIGPGRYTITPEQARQLDIVLAAPMHWLDYVEKPLSFEESVFADHLARMFHAALDCPGVNIVVHPLLLPGEPGMDYDQARVIRLLTDHPATLDFFRRAVRQNVGLEVSPKYIFGPHHEWVVKFYQRALTENVKLACNSDGHALHMMDVWDQHERFLGILGVTDTRQLWLPNDHLAPSPFV